MTPLKQFYLNMFQYKNLLTGFKSSKTILDVKPSSGTHCKFKIYYMFFYVNGRCTYKKNFYCFCLIDGNNLKKVRFGSATLRLIPSNTSLEPKQNNIYPKLTMIINNKKKLGSNMPVLTNFKSNVFDDNKISSMFKSDNQIQNRLLKRKNSETIKSSPTKKFCSVHDRLG